MIVVEVPYQSDLWEAFLQVRREVLRWPLGLEYTEADLASETGDVCLLALNSPPAKQGGELGDEVDLHERVYPLTPALSPLGGEGANSSPCLQGERKDLDCRPLGGLLLRPHGPELKMRQVAVRADLQGKGVGKRLVEASEDYARTHNYPRIVLHARTSAVPFYLALGYETEGDEFEEAGIPHLFMFKNLTR